MLPPQEKNLGQSNLKTKSKQFIFSNKKSVEGAKFLVGVKDGNYPDVWIATDSPYSNLANIDNFVWALDLWETNKDKK